MTEWEDVFTKRNPDYGGVGVLLTGLPGSGKSNALALIALNELKRGNVVIWRAKSTCQWTILLNKTKKIIFWLKKGLEYKLIDRKQGKVINIEDIVEVRRWTTTADLVKNLSKTKINIIQTTPVSPEWFLQHIKFVKEWIRILQKLCDRYYSTPISILFDEFEDLAPEGKLFRTASTFSDMTKELRKNDINYFGATHRTTEIFWKVVNKIPWHIYMKGAMPHKKSRVFSSVTIKLKVGHAVIEGGRFEKCKFGFVGDERDYRAIIKLSKEEKARLKEQERRIEIKKNFDMYKLIYEDVMRNNLSQIDAAKKYNVTQPRISQILKEVEKTIT